MAISRSTPSSQSIRSMNDICRRSIEREMLSPEFLWASATGWIGDGGVG
jgi:hypothetical protein